MRDREGLLVAARLREARESLGLTQEEVSEALSIPRTSVAALEAGKRSVSALEIRRLARLYRRQVEWLMGDSEAPTASTDGALYRATSGLSAADKDQVLRFAEFLASSSGSTASPRQQPRRQP